eukprot:CAMPEP_0170514380 /NCGR_PEP_ID=MMETSP0209-20121228/942_1 /TAXON_ID=665100 ORGANISM="Litonotus pictus, Strain P1" /NCGR_SAMPLE_ID=MMETSP0209 /ASSEMBLY_ACC=CAM_ASM_000301 /LENGTH=585 /DNA_ID=CAMNT_0010798443 /DNA_START=16 /DNA_END=1773 /DNA_ORIENTATION=+
MDSNSSDNNQIQTTSNLDDKKKNYEKYSKALNYDFPKIKKVIDQVKDVNLDKIKYDFRDFKESSSNNFNKRMMTMKTDFEEKLSTIRQKMKSKVSGLIEETRNSENQIEISGYEIPSESFTFDDVKKNFEKLVLRSNVSKKSLQSNNTKDDSALDNSNQMGKSLRDQSVSEVENIVGLIKKFSDNEKLSKSFKVMENLIYWKYLNEKWETISSSVGEKREAMLKTVKDQITELKFNFIQQKESSSYILPFNLDFSTKPSNLKKELLIAETCQKAYTIDSVFVAFNTNDQVPYLSWTNTAHTVDIYSLEKGKITQQMKGHNQHIYIVRHFYDKRINTDFLLSTSYDKKAIVWRYNPETQEFAIHLSINTSHSGLYLYSGLLLFDFTSEKAILDSSMVITSVPNEQLKIFNFKGTLIRHLGTKSDYTYYINSYYDTKKNCFYIVNANSQDVKILDYKEGTTLKVFKDDNTSWHMSAFICDLNNMTYLFESDGNGNIRIWDFEKVKISKKLTCSGCSLRGIVLWNEKLIVAASSDKSFKFFDMDSGKIEHSQVAHENVLCSVQKIVHPKYGESLITCAIDGKLKLWSA